MNARTNHRHCALSHKCTSLFINTSGYPIHVLVQPSCDSNYSHLVVSCSDDLSDRWQQELYLGYVKVINFSRVLLVYQLHHNTQLACCVITWPDDHIVHFEHVHKVIQLI